MKGATKRTRGRHPALIEGAVAGAVGASWMTVFRMLAHRLGVIDEMVPQVVEEWARRKLHLRPADGAPSHHAIDQALHFAYGLGWGALFAALARRIGPARSVVPFGLAQWAFGSMVLFPGLRIGRPAWRSRPRENAINVASHLLYAAVTAFVTTELARQTPHHPGTRERMRVAPVG